MSRADEEKRDALRPHAKQLAKLLATERGACVLGSLQRIQMLWRLGGAGQLQRGGRSRTDEPELQIGVWRREPTGSAFHRIPEGDARNRFADVEIIPPKATTRKRVLLFGESAARAYYYDPALTLASLLERAVGHAFEPLEVVDLASIGQSLSDLEHLLQRSEALEPDAIVVFAGNNWIFDPIPDLDEPPIGEALGRGDFAAARSLHVEQVLVKRVYKLFDLMADVLRRRRIPGLFVLPEFNLVDHVDETHGFVPLLASGRIDDWIDRRAQAEAARDHGDRDGCVAYALAMLELDRGLHPAGHRFLADCARVAGNEAAAYQHYSRARDASSPLVTNCPPRCPAAVQTAIRSACRANGIALVDLCELFKHAHGLPDRELFLDYCHLTLRGLRLAAGEIAARLVPLLGGPGVARADVDVEPSIDALDAASAHFLAAIHNAHVGAGLDMILYRCTTALNICPRVSVLMQHFLDFRSRRSPDWMAHSYAEALESRPMRRFLLTPSLPLHLATVDIPLNTAIEDALEAHGVPARDRFERLRLTEAAGDDGQIDLLRYRRMTIALLESRPYGYHRSRHPVSSFYLLTKALARVTLRVTWRAPGARGGDAVIRLNGEPVLEAPVGPDWATRALELPPDVLRSGTNVLQIQWPRSGARPARMRTDIASLVRPAPDDYYVFGEVQQLKAHAIV